MLKKFNIPKPNGLLYVFINYIRGTSTAPPCGVLHIPNKVLLQESNQEKTQRNTQGNAKKTSFYGADKKYLDWQEKWQNRLKKESSELNEIATAMDKVNPILIARNHIIADIIQQSVFKNDYSEFNEFLQAIQNPFTENKKYHKYYSQPQEHQKVLNTFCGT